jgi:hypothetical protein
MEEVQTNSLALQTHGLRATMRFAGIEMRLP